MLRPDGYVKVLDFGLAKLTDSQGRAGSAEETLASQIRTAAGIVLGTVGYMSPEQARGQRVDSRGDIFSLGVVIYEMLAGISPFAAPTAADTVAAILSKEAVPLRQVVSDIPAELERVVAKTLAKDRESR